MTEFLNYNVDLYLKDGSVSSGKISVVDNVSITLTDVSRSTDPDQSISSIQYPNSSISDLKVTKLPADLLKNLKNKPKAKKEPKQKNKGKKEEKAGLDLAKNAVTNDFDFEANLKMFDKKTVFEDFQKKDTIRPEERLVGHNKIDNVRKEHEKLRNDEMVLDGKKDQWDLLGNLERKDNLKHASATGRTTPLNDSTINALSKSYSLANLSTGNIVPVCSPIQLLDIERIASETLSHSHALMDEVFATNLSLYINRIILGGASRLNPNNHNLPPLVVLLIGSERCSARAFAVGRHLANHGVRVLAFVVNQESQEPNYLSQKEMFQQADGKVISTSVSELLHILNNQLNTPVELIIDALQGYDDHLDDIFYEQTEQESIRELISWCNLSQLLRKVMSLDIPSGIDGGSGTITDPSLVINCKWCVSMGLPVAGILHAYRNSYLHADNEITHILVDVGIPNKVYHRKSNLRKFDKVWFGAEHVVKINLIEKTD